MSMAGRGRGIDPPFFLLDVRKILIRLQLGRGDPAARRQNIETEGVRGKIFQDKDLADGATRRG